MPAGGFTLYDINQKRNSTSRQGVFINSTFTGATSLMDPWEGVASGTYGWFVAGHGVFNTIPISSVDRVDTSNDTTWNTNGTLASLPATMNSSIPYNFSNRNYGRFFSGSVGFNLYKLDFSNDSPQAVPANSIVSPNPSLIQPAGASIWTANYGWTVGGGGAPGLQYSYVNRMNFATDDTIYFRGHWSRELTLNGGLSTLSYGWSCGGVQPSGGFIPFSTVERIDFANDDVAPSVRGPLTAAAWYVKGIGNLDYGYVTSGFGFIGNRIDYSNDTAAALSRAFLFSGQYGNNLFGNTNFGYSGGRYTFPAATVYSTVSRIEFANDTALASIRNPLPIARCYPGAASNHEKSRQRNLFQTNESISFWMGGLNPSTTSQIDRLNFFNDTYAARGQNLITAMYSGMAVNSNNAAYMIGGYNGSAVTSTVQRINFHNDQLAVTQRSRLNTSRATGGISGNANFGWVMGGSTVGPAFAGYSSAVERIDYSSENINLTARANLPATLSWRSAAAGNANYGWINATEGGSPQIIYRIEYANDTQAASTRGSLSAQRTGARAVSNEFYGWWANGFNGSIVNTSHIDRIDFSNDTATSSLRSNLTSARYSFSAAGSSAFGWWGGGYIPGGGGRRSEIDRLQFANDLVTATVRANFAAAKSHHGATSNYIKVTYPRLFLGGASLTGQYAYVSQTSNSTTDRIDFSNDSNNLLARGQQASGASRSNNMTAMANSNFFYTMGGNLANLDRLTIANDTAVAVLRAPVTATLENTTFGNDNYGYHVVGFASSSPRSTIERIDYNNDSLTPSVRGNSLLTRPSAIAVANGTFGWVGTGWQPNYGTSIDRMQFANDTVNNISRAAMTIARYGGNGLSSRLYGWFYNGSDVSNPQKSSIERYDFSNDAASSGGLVRSNMPVSSAIRGASMSSSAFGYFKLFNFSTVYRLELANDTVNPVNRGFSNLPSSISGAGGAANYVVDVGDIINPSNYSIGNHSISTEGTFGWWLGGSLDGAGGPRTSSTQRLDFSNDGSNAIARGNLTIARSISTGVANSVNGFNVGGNIASPTITAYSTVERITFSSDTAALISRGPLSVAKLQPGSNSTEQYGWIGGGQTYSAPVGYTTVSSMDRLDFANDLPTTQSRGPLVNGAIVSSAVNNNFYGWWASSSPSISSISRVDFSNDTATSLLRTSLSAARYDPRGISTAVYGWFAGGGQYLSPIVSTLERLDFSTDTLAAVVRGSLLVARYRANAVGNSSNGWWGGGQTGGGPTNVPRSETDRLSFYNDTLATVARGTLVQNTDGTASVDNYSF